MSTAETRAGESKTEGSAHQGRLHCVVVTPERKVVDESADFVVLPLYDGELGVSPLHSPLVGRLGHGELRIRRGGDVQRLFVDGGFVQVRSDVVTVLTERVDPITEIDLPSTEAELAEALKRSAEDDYGISQREKAVLRARAKLRLARRMIR